MKRQIDENLNLEQLLSRCKELDQDEWINVYYDMGPKWFYINHESVLPFWIPRGAYHLCGCLPRDVRSIIENTLSYAVRQLTKTIET